MAGQKREDVAVYDDFPLPAESSLNAPRTRCLEYLFAAVNFVLPHGGIASSVFNMASATLGATIVALPHAVSESGIVLGMVFLVLCAVATVYSIHLLVKTFHKTGLVSYEEMARHILGGKMDKLSETMMIILCWGSGVAYVIVLGSLFKPFQTMESLPAAFRGEWGNRLFVAIVFCLAMWPLALFKYINALRYVSAIGVTMIVYLVVLMVAHSLTNGFGTHRVEIARWNNRMLVAVSLMLFAFCIQPNVLSIYSEMVKPTPRKLVLCAVISSGVCCILYFLSGFFGYSDFGQHVHGSVLVEYNPTHSIAFAIVYIGLTVKLVAAFELSIFPTRDSIFYSLNWGSYQTVSSKRRIVVSSILAVAAVLCGMFLPRLEIVFGLLGGLCGSMIGFSMAASLHLR